MKHAVTFRLDPDLLAAARHCATRENRTLTNFVETVIKQHLIKTIGPAETPVKTRKNRSRTTGSGPVSPASSIAGRLGE